MPKKQKPRHWLAGAALQNPILVQAAGLTPVIVAATSLQGALWVSGIIAVHLILCELLASRMKGAPSWLRAALYFAIGLAIACPTAYLLDGLTATYTAMLHVFMPLMAVNALTAMRCERYAVLHTPRDALRDALSNALGFAVVAVIAGAVRELLGYGTLWDKSVLQNLHIRGAWMPFGGFLLLGAMAALLKVTLRALSARGIYAGADKALELAPENRLERLEKTRKLLISEVREALKEKEEPRQTPPPVEEDLLEAFVLPAQEPEAPPRQPRIPVDDILREYGLGHGDDGLPHVMTEDEKMRLVLELEELLDDFKGGDAS
jgi:Na+-translocating ferredoxin:NAD+ oxidoreductase RnfE subunit